MAAGKMKKEFFWGGVRRSTFILWFPNIVCLGFRQRGTQDCSNQTPSLCVLMLHGGPPTHCWFAYLEAFATSTRNTQCVARTSATT